LLAQHGRTLHLEAVVWAVAVVPIACVCGLRWMIVSIGCHSAIVFWRTTWQVT
jgi:hypothetical protein